MFLRLSVCVIIITLQVIYAAPFSENVDHNKIEVSQKTRRSSDWTDIVYDDEAIGGPDYMEYEHDHSNTEKISTQEMYAPTMDGDGNPNPIPGSGQFNKNDVDTLRPFSSLNKKMEVGEEEDIKKSNKITIIEADEADQQINNKETQEMVTDKNKDDIDDKNQQKHNLIKEKDLTMSRGSQKIHVPLHEVKTQERKNQATDAKQVDEKFSYPTQTTSTSTKQTAKTQNLNMIHNTLITIPTLPQVNPSRTPYSTIITTDNDQKTTEHTKIDPTTKNSKPYSQKNVPTLESTALRHDIKIEDDDSDENLYRTLIQAQIAKTENLIRKIEAIRNSESGIVDKPEGNIDSEPELNQVANDNDKDDILREGDTQPSQSTRLSKVSFPQPPEKAVKTQSAQSSMPSQNKAPSANDIPNQQTNEEETPSIDKIALQKNILKLVQSELSSSNIATPSSKMKPNTGGRNNFSDSVSTSTSVAQQFSNDDGTEIFNSSKKIKLPNGSWAPSCKNVVKGKYCMMPDGEGQAIVECSEENVGFQFSCGGTMMCYSVGPHDVDCQTKNQNL